MSTRGPESPPAQDGRDETADSLIRQAVRSDAVFGDTLPMPAMNVGDVVAGRFVLEAFAGRGGMGAVYQARDRRTGARVALKVMANRQDPERFAREARVLSELTHPAIVRYVAHGTTLHGQPFLAMEWLDGEDLSQRLRRGGLSVAESLSVVRRVAEGLAVAHARGIVHRDVKPSNVMLVGGQPAVAKLLDFGVARLQLPLRAATAEPLTGAGTVVGTLGYMSPEQAISDPQLDARTDVFALGCVLFECLTGRPVFSGEHVVAVLAKVLREEARRVRDFRPDLPAALDEIVARMLTKDRRARPPDGGAVLREIEALGSIAGGVPVAGAVTGPGLSGGEQRLVSVLVAMLPDEPQRAREVVQAHGGEAARLANGVLLVTPADRGTTTEQVTLAACALALNQAFPLGRIAVATGRAQATAAGPSGPVIDHAASLLARSTSPGVRIDEVTAGLLGERFEVKEDGQGLILAGRRSEADVPRTLLGKPTPCVGRDKELALLEGTLNECIDESVARAVLVTGPAGQGKSRLRYEFVAKTRARGDVQVLCAGADPVGAGSAFVLVRQLVRDAFGLREGDPAAQQGSKLRAHVGEVCEGPDSARIADFLGELVGVAPSERLSAQLCAARNDPRIMGEWLRRSFGEWLAGECAARPVLLVLEDLHWGDLPSVTYVGDALRTLSGRPLMVLALARPEVSGAFPHLWAGSEKQEIALGRLSLRAAQRLVMAALGDRIEADDATRIVERADGNAFYLEELIRRVAEGEPSLPETVLALVQSRLERLEAEARRIVRAASVFGEVFWRGGLDALLGGGALAGELDAWLAVLAEREVLTVANDCRFPGEREYVFRHGLLRDAAYEMLTDSDRATGHCLAGQWLEQAGEKDALTLADHLERGGELARAVPWLMKAAQTALDGGNVEAAIALGHRGIACGPPNAERGLLRLVQAIGLGMRANWLGCVETMRDAMQYLPSGSAQWFLSAAGAFLAGMCLGDPSITTPVLTAILQVEVEPEPSGPYGFAVLGTCVGLESIGQAEAARGFLRRAEVTPTASSAADPMFALYLHVARAYLDLRGGDPGAALASLSQARAVGDRIGDVAGRGAVGMFTAAALVETGSCERVEAMAREVLSLCGPVGLHVYCDWCTLYVATARLDAGRGADAIAALTSLLERPDPFLVACARALLGQAFAIEGDAESAVRESTAIVEQGSMFLHAQTAALAALAVVELRRDEPAEGLAFAERGLAAASLASWPRDVALLHLVRAEALHRLGRWEAARNVVREARDRIERVASAFEDRSLRASYLDIETNRRTLALASDWLVSERVEEAS